MRQTRRTELTLSAAVSGALVICCAARASAADAPPAKVAAPADTAAPEKPKKGKKAKPEKPQPEKVAASAETAAPAKAKTEEVPPPPPALQPKETEEATLPPVVSSLDFEASAHLSVMFAELAVPDAGSLNPVGFGGYVAMRYVPTTFPFHAYFETGGGLFATGTSTGPSGTAYDNALSAWFFSPGIGFDLSALRFTLGIGPALVMTRHSSPSEDTSSLSVAVASDVGVAYRFFEDSPWATSVGLRYQTIPGAKIDALSLGVQFRFGSVTYR